MLSFDTYEIRQGTAGILNAIEEIRNYLNNERYAHSEYDVDKVRELKEKIEELRNALKVIDMQLPELEHKANLKYAKRAYDLKHAKKKAQIKLTKGKVYNNYNYKVAIIIEWSLKTDTNIPIDNKVVKLLWNERKMKDDFIQDFKERSIEMGVLPDDIDIVSEL